MSAVRSIPTVYGNTQFRSRLEASWAAFFDKHEIQWVYEAEGFDLNGVWYLPDFFLPKQKVFVEVKGLLDTLDRTKLSRLAMAAVAVDAIVVIAETPVGLEFSWIKPSIDFVASNEIELVLCEGCGRWTFTTTRPSLIEKTLPDENGNPVAEVVECGGRDCRYEDHKGEKRQWVAMGGFSHRSECDVCGRRYQFPPLKPR